MVWRFIAAFLRGAAAFDEKRLAQVCASWPSVLPDSVPIVDHGCEQFALGHSNQPTSFDGQAKGGLPQYKAAMNRRTPKKLKERRLAYSESL